MPPPRKQAPIQRTRPVRKQQPSDNYASFKVRSLVGRAFIAGLMAGGAAYWYAKVLPGMLAAGSFKKLHLNLGVVDFQNKQIFAGVVGLFAFLSVWWLFQGIRTYFEERAARGRPSASSWS